MTDSLAMAKFNVRRDTVYYSVNILEHHCPSFQQDQSPWNLLEIGPKSVNGVSSKWGRHQSQENGHIAILAWQYEKSELIA